MTTNKNVSLDVRDQPPTMAGYKSTLGSDGKIYYFRYTGGDPEHQDGTVTNERSSTLPGDITFDVDLIESCTRNYHIDSVTFNHDANPSPQLTAEEVAGSRDRKRTIRNRNNAKLNGRYTVHVKRIGTTVSIPCDPPIINRQQT